MNTSLKALIDQAVAKHGGASGRALGLLAQKHGHKIVGTTINGIRNGTYKFNPSDETIRAIAWLAGVPEAEAFTAAGKPIPGPPFAAELPPGVDNLSARSRKAALAMLSALVHAEAGTSDAQDDDTPTTDDGHDAQATTVADPPAPGTPRPTDNQEQKTRPGPSPEIEALQARADSMSTKDMIGLAADHGHASGDDEETGE
ncbi:hypothetical protein NQ036_03855 [Brevibacterium sp. 91QC2O2]|uniref:hypothetical protein n=1 Tax=Brevibacterium TaxID=1696 RepID=UPI00211C25AD|nr:MULTISPECIES: hypothetical protein [unclassified Brevibacterium]MCQ9367382.1 hypothetical protein [Brevibacterium sp. 91QC2O2]MCQ9384605.1 hypothetical protein [Brevibacterium sp. 68QC2CO]